MNGHRTYSAGTGSHRITASRTASPRPAAKIGAGCRSTRGATYAPPPPTAAEQPQWQGGMRPHYYASLLYMSDERAGDWKR